MPQDDRSDGAGLDPPGNRPVALSALLEELIRARPERDPSPWERALRPGVQVGRYEILREIGRGGFGIVYEARDRETSRLVAFKAVLPGDREGRLEERLLREADVAARLSHPNIVTLYGFERCEQGAYLVFELLRGRTLAERLRQGPLTLREGLRIAVELGGALAHAHGNGVVHRDLTPANVYLCEDGRVKLLDLGLAHAFGQRRLLGGTPHYMAPEQRRGAPEDERTDVFAFGVVLFQMLTGDLPFPAGRAGARRFARKAQAIEVREMPGLGLLVARMLELDPVARPRDASEVLAALAAFQEELARAPGSAVAAAVRIGPPRRRVASLRSGRRGRRGSVAVLPFADMSPERDQQYFSDGLAEEILNALTHVEGLRVMGRTSSFAFRGRDNDRRAVGRRLGVTAVLDGSVRKAGNRVRITAQLVDVSDGFHLWSQTYDRELDDVLAVQDEIARSVAEALTPRLLGGKASPARRRVPPDPEVYKLFLLGRHFFNRGTLEDFRLAVEAFEGALALDPGFAPAQAALAPALAWMHDMQGYRELPDILAAHQRVLSAADRAVALAPDLADGYTARADARTIVGRDWAGAERDLERALELRPGDAGTQLRRGHLMAVLGRLPEAVAMTRQAVDLDPMAADAWRYLGSYQNALGEHELARDALDRALEISPDHVHARVERGLTHLYQRQAALALDQFERSGATWSRLFGASLARHDLGDPAGSDHTLATLSAGFALTTAYQIGEVHAWRGEADLAFEWLERAFTQRDPGLRRMGYDPLLAGLHGDPRFTLLLRRMNLPLGGAP